jgi:hypothetical protein
VNSVLDAYVDARPHLVTGNSLFGVSAYGLSHRLTTWQARYLEPTIGFPARWSYHPYRSLAVVTIMKNPRIADPIGVASALLVDSAQMVRAVYGHLRPEDHNTTAASATYSPHELTPLVSSAVYQGHSR